MPRKSAFKCYFGCDPIQGKFHQFPRKTTDKFNQWKMVLNPKDQRKGDTYILNNIHMCDRHFEKFYRSGSGRLTGNAVPTLNIGFDGTVLHCFPNPEKHPDRFRTWINSIGGDILALENKIIYKYRRVCNNHFLTRFHTTGNRLSANATPTLNIPGSTTTDKTPMQEDSNIDIETDKPDETERRIDLDNTSSSNGCNITEPYPEFLETEFLDDIDTDVDEDPLALVPESESEEMEILYDLEPSIDPRMQDALNLHAQILKKGLKKDTKEALFKQYIIPEKFSLLHAPKLNPELSEAVTERIRAIDARVVVAQEQLGQGIAALYEGLELLINDSKENLAIKALSDSCQILCDLHHMQTQSRRNLIETNVDKELLNILQDLERDAFLFGNHLSETIKECKEKEETQKLVLVKSNLDTEILNFIQDENQEFSLENEVIADTNANKDNTIRGLRKIVFVDINVDNKGKDVKQDLRLEKEFETTKLGTQKVVNHNIDQKYSNVSQDLPFRYELLENSNTSKNIDEQNLEETENLDIQFPNVMNAEKGLLGNNRARKIKASKDAVKQLHILSPSKRPSTSAQQAVLQSINSTLSSNKQGGLKRTIVRKVKFLRPVKRATPTRVDSEQPTSDEDSPAWMYKT
ncbi:uncharacterized protein LOC112046146 isoform X3 [Bicyclus anynana]|uniref:Uncharacterized protein LOC112046146 isoform X3 n=1 Tax=Bicyclus anynana TaxID=110368 RepID=A0ABM3M3X4_BICAN|nr:uncharacterized protein LOC112046146 isoform X3 [Bicyclus anynana]